MENKKRRLFSDAHKIVLLWTAAAFGLTLVVSLAVLAIKKVYPFGENSMLFSDMITEYLPLLSEFYDKIKEGGSLFWSWRTGLGGNFWGTYAYCLASPLNLIIILFKRSQIQYVMCGLVLFKQALAAANMSMFLSLRKGGKSGFWAFLCGILYAFCGWYCSYYFTVIWLDTYCMLPILALAIERLVDTYRPWLYIPVLTFLIFSNFYMAYFGCVSAVLYFLYYTLTQYPHEKQYDKKGHRIKTPLRNLRLVRAFVVFAGASLFSALLLSWFLVPLGLLLISNEANDVAIPCTALFTNIPEQMAALFSGNKGSSSMYVSFPNVYMGLFPVIVLPQYLGISSISKRKKIFSVVIFVFFILSFNLQFLDYFWHGFRYPTGIPFREAFVFTFFMLSMTHDSLCRLRSIKLKKSIFSIAAVLFIIICGLIYLNGNYSTEILSFGAVIITIIILVAEFLVFGLLIHHQKRKKLVKVLSVGLCLLTVIDVAYTRTEQLPEELLSRKMITETADGIMEMEASANNEEPFYRSEMTFLELDNNGSIYKYNGISQSSSVVDSRSYTFLNRMGIESNRSNQALYINQTPIFHSLFGLSYLYERSEYDDFPGTVTLADHSEEGYVKKAEVNGVKQYEYKYAMPLWMIADEQVLDWEISDFNAPENQNQLMKAVSGCGDLIVFCENEMAPTNDEDIVVREVSERHIMYTEENSLNSGENVLAFRFVAKQTGPAYLYFDLFSEYNSNWELYIRDASDDEILVPKVTRTMLVCVGDLQEGEEFFTYYVPNETYVGEFSIAAFQIHMEKLQAACEMLKTNGMIQINNVQDTVILGNVDIEKNEKVVLTTVPSFSGWTVYVDDEVLPEDQIYSVGEGLLAFKLSEGLHAVKMKYSLPGLSAGIIVTCITAALGVCICLFVYYKRKRRPE